MAYVRQLEQDDEEELKKQQQSGQPLQVAESPGGPISGGAIEGAPDQQKTPQALRPSGFTDVKSYLEANREQAAGLAGKIGGRLKGEAGEIESAIGKAGQEFEKGVKGSKIGYDEGLVESAFQSPLETMADEAKMQQLAKMRGAQYAGPLALKGTQEYADLESRIAEAEKRKGQIESEAGRTELLRSAVQRPTEGSTRLDQLLLGADPTSRQTLRQSVSPFDQLRGYLTSMGTEAEKAGTQAKTETEETKRRFGERATAAQTAFQKQLDERLAQKQGEATARAEAARVALAQGGEATPQILSDLGITAEDLAGIRQNQAALKRDYGIDTNLADWLQQEKPVFGVPQVAGAQDLAVQQALANIAGQEFGPLRPEDVGQFGTANLDLSQYNLAGAQGLKGILGDRDKGIIDKWHTSRANDLTPADRAAYEQAKLRNPEYDAQVREANKVTPPPLTDIINQPFEQMTGGLIPNPLDKAAGIATTIEDTKQHLENIYEPARQVRDELNRVGQTLEKTFGNVVGQDVKNVVGNIAETALKAPLQAAQELANIIKDPGKALKAVEQAVKNPAKAVESIANNVSNAVKKIFCFAPGTMIDMANGSSKPIEHIKLGEKVDFGGRVLSIRQSLTDDIFKYYGVLVTGYHAVFDFEKWVRVKDSPCAKQTPYSGVVYSLVTDNHRIISNGLIFADEHETDQYENVGLDESLKLLNADENGPERRIQHPNMKMEVV